MIVKPKYRVIGRDERVFSIIYDVASLIEGLRGNNNCGFCPRKESTNYIRKAMRYCDNFPEVINLSAKYVEIQ